jgi:uncharacterized alkaline shock family protein YloU
MRIFMRILLTLYLLFFLAVAGVALCCAWGLIGVEYPTYWLDLLYGNLGVKWIVSVIAVVVVLVSFMLMFSGIRRRKPKSAMVRLTEGGTISITLSALEEMTMRFIASNESVRNVRASVGVRDGKLNIHAKLAVAEGTNIPEVLQSLQSGLKTHVEVLAGIEVNKIMLLVEKTTQAVKARVE